MPPLRLWVVSGLLYGTAIAVSAPVWLTVLAACLLGALGVFCDTRGEKA